MDVIAKSPVSYLSMSADDKYVTVSESTHVVRRKWVIKTTSARKFQEFITLIFPPVDFWNLAMIVVYRVDSVGNCRRLWIS